MQPLLYWKNYTGQTGLVMHHRTWLGNLFSAMFGYILQFIFKVYAIGGMCIIKRKVSHNSCWLFDYSIFKDIFFKKFCLMYALLDLV